MEGKSKEGQKSRVHRSQTTGFKAREVGVRWKGRHLKLNSIYVVIKESYENLLSRE